MTSCFVSEYKLILWKRSFWLIKTGNFAKQNWAIVWWLNYETKDFTLLGFLLI